MKFEIDDGGKIYDCEWFDDTNFEALDSISGARGFIFDDKNRVCIYKVKKNIGWNALGGRAEEEDNSPEETLIREVNEEVDIELKDIKRVGYLKAIPRDKTKKSEIIYEPRFVARVKEFKERTIDPAEGVMGEMKFVKPKEFCKYTGWGKDGEFQLKKALEKLKSGS